MYRLLNPLGFAAGQLAVFQGAVRAGLAVEAPISESYGSSEQRGKTANWPRPGTLVVAGPKVLEFYDDLCNHRATSLKSDGKDILAVTMVLNAERDVDAPSALSLT